MAAAAGAAFLLGAGCGDDGGPAQKDTESATTPRTPTETAPPGSDEGGEQTSTGPGDLTTPGVVSPRPRRPEDEPGGAGDEEPAASQAILIGRGGRITPRRVRVPPFIAIRLELRSADRGRYALRFGRRTITASPGTPSRATTFDGLRPGRRLVGSGRSGGVIIEASAEPGP